MHKCLAGGAEQPRFEVSDCATQAGFEVLARAFRPTFRAPIHFVRAVFDLGQHSQDVVIESGANLLDEPCRIVKPELPDSVLARLGLDLENGDSRLGVASILDRVPLMRGGGIRRQVDAGREAAPVDDEDVNAVKLIEPLVPRHDRKVPAQDQDGMVLTHERGVGSAGAGADGGARETANLTDDGVRESPL